MCKKRSIIKTKGIFVYITERAQIIALFLIHPHNEHPLFFYTSPTPEIKTLENGRYSLIAHSWMLYINICHLLSDVTKCAGDGSRRRARMSFHSLRARAYSVSVDEVLFRVPWVHIAIYMLHIYIACVPYVLMGSRARLHVSCVSAPRNKLCGFGSPLGRI